MWLIGCKLASNPVKLCCCSRLLLPGFGKGSKATRGLTGQLIAYWICVLIAVHNEFKKAEVTASHWPSRAGNVLLFNLDIIRSTCVFQSRVGNGGGVQPPLPLSPPLSHSLPLSPTLSPFSHSLPLSPTLRPSAIKSQFIPFWGFFPPTPKVGLTEVIQWLWMIIYNVTGLTTVICDLYFSLSLAHPILSSVNDSWFL